MLGLQDHYQGGPQLWLVGIFPSLFVVMWSHVLYNTVTWSAVLMPRPSCSHFACPVVGPRSKFYNTVYKTELNYQWTEISCRNHFSYVKAHLFLVSVGSSTVIAKIMRSWTINVIWVELEQYQQWVSFQSLWKSARYHARQYLKHW